MAAPTPQKQESAVRLIVSRRSEGRIGTLSFDAENRIRLQAEASGPVFDELKKAVAEIEAMPKVPSVITVREETPRGRVTATETYHYGRDDPNYFTAVLDTLSRVYGFRADIDRG